MKGEERYLTNLLEGTKTRFIVPVYQRNYDWKIEHCNRLFDDIEDVIKEQRESHFFGSIVSKAERDVRIIIDGQQRITTTFLLLRALIAQVDKGRLKVEDDQLTDRVRHEYLVDKYHKDEVKLKLKLVKDDQEAYARLFDPHNTALIEESNVTQNYRYFLNRLAETRYNADDILSGIEKLMVIDITLGKDDDAQLIFESLNSTGLDLSEGDKIRNFILMDLDAALQEQYYEQFWRPIEKHTDYKVSDFVRDWLAAKLRQTPNVRKVYAIFRKYVKQSGMETRGLLEEMLEYAKHYHAIRNAATSSAKINSVLQRIGLLKMNIVNPFLLTLLAYHAAGKISDEEAAEAIRSVEIYIFRRWACGDATNVLNKVFVTLHTESIKLAEDGESYCNVLNYVLHRKEGSARIPLDAEFRRALDERDFYRIQTNNKFYLYERLENGDSRERIEVVRGLEDGTLTIEHIMPQNLSSAWKTTLGDNHKAIHEKWVNRLANLTLTGYNQQYSNKQFSEKRDAPNGFKDSGLRMNRYIASCDAWSEAELEKRNEQLKDDFLRLWPLPSTTFKPKSDIHEEYDLEENFDFTSHKIAAYTFMGTRYPVKNWKDMICGVLSQIGELEPVALRKYVNENEFPAGYFSKQEEEPSRWVKVAQGVYFNSTNSTSAKCDILRHVFDRVGLDYNELSFILHRKENG